MCYELDFPVAFFISFPAARELSSWAPACAVSVSVYISVFPSPSVTILISVFPSPSVAIITRLAGLKPSSSSQTPVLQLIRTHFWHFPNSNSTLLHCAQFSRETKTQPKQFSPGFLQLKRLCSFSPCVAMSPTTVWILPATLLKRSLF